MSEKIYGQFDLETIEKLADIVKNKDLGEITIADGDKVITVKGKKCPPPAPMGMPMPMAVGTALPAAQTAPEASATSAPVTGGKAVKAPIVGTFYAAPSPDSKPFVSVGDKIKKGETREEMIAAVKKSEGLGIPTSLTFLSGIGGRKMWRENAIDTGTMISEMEPTYVSFLTLMVVPGTPLHDEMMRGEFELLRPDEVLKEAQLMLENINVTRKCVFRSNHASNYVSLKGDLPDDRDAMIKQLEVAQKHSEMWKDERFRML